MHLFHGMLSILKYIYIFKITPQIYIQFTKCKLKVWKIEQIILNLMHFNCVEIVQLRYTEVYLIVLKWNYCKYISGTL